MRAEDVAKSAGGVSFSGRKCSFLGRKSTFFDRRMFVLRRTSGCFGLAEIENRHNGHIADPGGE